MNVQRDPDAILAAWLEEGPNRLPEQTRRAIEVNTRTTEQKRRSLWAPWRTPLMTPFARVAIAAIAVIALTGGAVYLFRPGQGVGVAPPTPSPIVTAAPSSAPPPSEAPATVPVDWTTYTSSRFAYTIDYPADWGLTPATLDWPSIGFPDDANMDNLGPRPFGTQLFLSSLSLTGGKDAAAWTAELDSRTAGLCTELTNRHNITLDGVTARREDQYCSRTYHVIEVVTASGGRFYLIRFLTAAPSLTATDRATFDRVLASFRFGG